MCIQTQETEKVIAQTPIEAPSVWLNVRSPISPHSLETNQGYLVFFIFFTMISIGCGGVGLSYSPAWLLEVIWLGRKAHSIGHDEAQDPTTHYP